MKVIKSIQIEKTNKPIIKTHLFNINIKLIDNITYYLITGQTTKINIKLIGITSKSQRIDHTNLLSIDNANNIYIPPSGRLNLQARISSTPNDEGCHSFSLEISSENDPDIQIGRCDNIHVYKYYIKVKDIPNVWFKDCGGKNNWIELIISVYDQFQQLVRNQTIPIKISLYYENDCQNKVDNQRLLIFKDRNRLQFINARDNKIYFKINEVSRLHEKRKFCLKIEVDNLHSTRNDIAFVFVNPIEVRSKHSKTYRENQQQLKRTRDNENSPVENQRKKFKKQSSPTTKSPTTITTTTTTSPTKTFVASSTPLYNNENSRDNKLMMFSKIKENIKKIGENNNRIMNQLTNFSNQLKQFQESQQLLQFQEFKANDFDVSILNDDDQVNDQVNDEVDDEDIFSVFDGDCLSYLP